MIQPENLCPHTMEYAARLIEEGTFADWKGALSRRKRDREDAELRRLARQEARKEAAAYVRAMANRPDLSAAAVLDRIASAPERQHVLLLRDAWPLAWKRLVRIEALLDCASNTIPPETTYRITITDKGRDLLAQELTGSLASETQTTDVPQLLEKNGAARQD